jgi:tetratricopeptide (TPR) repeat protein
MEGEKRTIGQGIQIEFYMVPTYSEVSIPKTKYTGNNKGVEFKAVYYKYTDKPVVIVESLKENVSSAVYTICAFEYYERSEYDSALKTFKSIKNYENEENILFYIASCYYFEGEIKESLVYLDKAIEINPQFSEAWYNKGVVLDELGRFEEALEAYEKAIKINPQFSEAWNNRACVYSLMKNKDQAIFNLKHAIELDSSYKEMAKNNEDFKELWEDEDFKKLIE